jgi:hypothetical protein
MSRPPSPERVTVPVALAAAVDDAAAVEDEIPTHRRQSTRYDPLGIGAARDTGGARPAVIPKRRITKPHEPNPGDLLAERLRRSAVHSVAKD